MTKLKVGDKVVVVKHILPCNTPVGTISKIIKVAPWGVVDIEGTTDSDRWFDIEELELHEIWDSSLMKALRE